ncbi:MAG: hypothetical protein KGJ66_08290 [Alphaproteobacteria bacterium]|nr:hypothetical protein [Alphaproteobacteria bacterium]
MTDTARSTRGDRGAAVAASAAGVAAAGTFACAACCILPFALPAAVLAVAGGALAWLASIYEGAIVAAIALVAAAWIWVIRQSLRARKRPAMPTVMVMLAASVMLTLAYHWPSIEPIAVAALNAR